MNYCFTLCVLAATFVCLHAAPRLARSDLLGNGGSGKFWSDCSELFSSFATVLKHCFWLVVVAYCMGSYFEFTSHPSFSCVFLSSFVKLDTFSILLIQLTFRKVDVTCFSVIWFRSVFAAKPSDHGKINSITITPNPPVKGQSLRISANTTIGKYFQCWCFIIP